jgi:hypothetical protein
MKITSGVFAVLLLAAAVAVGQQHASYAEPFPQSANPALANGSAAEESSPALNGDVPSAMATNQSGTYTGRSNNFALGSPFLQAANPSLGQVGDQALPDSNINLGSPFPQAANPSSNR